MDQGQSITITIADKSYPLKASTPEMEQLMRVAAETINQKISVYNAKFPDKTILDKLAFVTLNEAMGRIQAQKKYAALEEQLKRLQEQTASYLEKIEEK